MSIINKASVRGKVATIHFGTNDVRDLAGNAEHVECWRISVDYFGRRTKRRCGHKHSSRAAAAKCARSMGRGSTSDEVKSWVEIRPREER